jgi:hypothetical protein
MLSQPIGQALAANRSTVASTTSTVQMLAANGQRKGLVVVNSSSASLYVIFGTGGSTTDYTYIVAPGATLDLHGTIYAGQIDCTWGSVNGSAFVTELI